MLASKAKGFANVPCYPMLTKEAVTTSRAVSVYVEGLEDYHVRTTNSSFEDNISLTKRTVISPERTINGWVVSKLFNVRAFKCIVARFDTRVTCVELISEESVEVSHKVSRGVRGCCFFLYL